MKNILIKEFCEWRVRLKSEDDNLLRIFLKIVWFFFLRYVLYNRVLYGRVMVYGWDIFIGLIFCGL